MLKYTLKIEGMACGMCEAHIKDTIRKVIPQASKITASHFKKSASFLCETNVDEEKLSAAIGDTGYTLKGIDCQTVSNKKLFKFFS